MKIARVIGTVTLSRAHPEMRAIPLRLVEVAEQIGDGGQLIFGGEPIVAADLLGTGAGDLIGMAEGPEAAQPYRPAIRPIDASTAAILDSVEI